MALLRHVSSGTHYTLLVESVIGRSSQCTFTLSNRAISTQHAAFRWTGSGWTLQDLGSINGTFLDGRRVPTATRLQVAVGSKIAFGDASDVYELIDASAPEASATSTDGRTECAEGGLLILPNSEHPEVTIYANSASAWIAEAADGSSRPIHDGEHIEVSGATWTLVLPTVLEATWTAKEEDWALHALSLRFSVSLDEETVDIDVIYREQTRALPPRAHGYLLLTLARNRIDDQINSDTPESEHGWIYIPDLLRMIASNENQFNVHIYRARRQFALAGITGATALIERRPGSRQIRIGVSRLEIAK